MYMIELWGVFIWVILYCNNVVVVKWEYSWIEFGFLE